MSAQGYILPKSYRKLGLTFFFLSVFVMVFVSYLIWARVTIIINPNTQRVNQEFIFDVKQGDPASFLASNNAVPGKVVTFEIEGDANFQATGSKVLTSDVVGEVTIVNNYSKEQSLVETTRLAFADDPGTVVLRLKRTVVVPPGSQVKVQVYAEDFENFKEIPVGQFIIPGLWEPIQEYIFAKNEKALNKERVEVALVTQADLDAAEDSLKEQLYQKALGRINGQIEAQETLWPKLINSTVQEVSHNAKPDDETSEFNSTMKLQATVVVFDESKVISLARDRLKSDLPIEKQLIDLDPSSFTYELEKYNIEANTANVKVTISGQSMLTGSADLLDKGKLTGLTEEEIKSYFTQFSEVESVEVDFQPAWLKKTPRFKEKIVIEFAK